jgi:CDP-diacylglycerol--serine O-phosphatidyltransferase
MLVVAWPQLMLFVICAGYAASGLVEKGVSVVIKAVGKRGGVGSDRPALEKKE